MATRPDSDLTASNAPPLHGKELPEESKAGKRLREQARDQALQDKSKKADFARGSKRHTDGK